MSAPAPQPKLPSNATNIVTTTPISGSSSQGLMTIGHYQIDPKDKLGKGGFGVVYKAYDGKSGGFVAIKQIELKKKTKLPQIRNEFNLMKKLHHEHIVKYIDHVETPDNLYIVMEYLESGSLANLVRRFKISEIMVAKYVAQILKGLAYLHSVGVIHRDIKGDNVLMTKHDRFPILKLADFGIAQNFSPSNSPQEQNHIAGSPYWMAPEIITLNGASFASDIWSVGALVVELLTGKPPYFDLAPTSALYRIVHDDDPPLPKNISKLAADFLRSCFQKTEQFRKTALELLEHGWIVKALQMDGDANAAVLDTTTIISPVSKLSTVKQGQQAKKVSDDSSDSWGSSDDDSEGEETTKQVTIQLRKPPVRNTVVKTSTPLSKPSPSTPAKSTASSNNSPVTKSKSFSKRRKALKDFAQSDDEEEEQEWFNDKNKTLQVKPSVIPVNNHRNLSDSEEEEDIFDSSDSEGEQLTLVIKKEQGVSNAKQIQEWSEALHIYATAEELQLTCQQLLQHQFVDQDYVLIVEWFPMNMMELLYMFLETPPQQRIDVWQKLVQLCFECVEKLCKESNVVKEEMIRVGLVTLCLHAKWGQSLRLVTLNLLLNVSQQTKQPILPLSHIATVDWNTLLADAIAIQQPSVIQQSIQLISILFQQHKQHLPTVIRCILLHSPLFISNLCQIINWNCKQQLPNTNTVPMDMILQVLSQMTTCRDVIIKTKLSLHCKLLLHILRKLPDNQKLSLLNLLRNLCMEIRVQDTLVQEANMIRALVSELSNLVFLTDALFDSKSVQCKMYGQCMLMLQTLCTFHETRISILAQESNSILILRRVIEKHLPVWDLAATLLLSVATTNSTTSQLFLKKDGLLTLLHMIEDKSLITWRVNAMNTCIDLLEHYSQQVEPFLCKNVQVFVRKCQEYTMSTANNLHWKSFVSTMVQLCETSSKFTAEWIRDKQALQLMLSSIQQSTVKFKSNHMETVYYLKDLFTWLRVILDTLSTSVPIMSFQLAFAKDCLLVIYKQIKTQITEEQVLLYSLAEQAQKQLERICSK